MVACLAVSREYNILAEGTMMTLHQSALMALIAITPVGLAMAQTTPPQDETSPSAASSPHQREATQSNTPEATTTNGSDPAAASTPHQRQATADTKASHKQMMKDCIARERANDSSLSKDQAKKTCKEQMKQNSDSMK
jgi:hypothetical protein